MSLARGWAAVLVLGDWRRCPRRTHALAGPRPLNPARTQTRDIARPPRKRAGLCPGIQHRQQGGPRWSDRTTSLHPSSWRSCAGRSASAPSQPTPWQYTQGSTLASARARLHSAESKGLVRSQRLLAGRPALFTATRSGFRAAGLQGFEPCRVSVANAPHAIECARVAAPRWSCAYPDHHVMGERELRRDERGAATPLASALLGRGPGGRPLLHRPDVVLWPQDARSNERLPVAVEVELTIKAPRRLLEICRARARCRCVAGTLYLVAADVERPLARAIAQAQAGGRIATCRSPRSTVARAMREAPPRVPSPPMPSLAVGGRPATDGDQRCPISRSTASFSSVVHA